MPNDLILVLAGAVRLRPPYSRTHAEQSRQNHQPQLLQDTECGRSDSLSLPILRTPPVSTPQNCLLLQPTGSSFPDLVCNFPESIEQRGVRVSRDATLHQRRGLGGAQLDILHQICGRLSCHPNPHRSTGVRSMAARKH